MFSKRGPMGLQGYLEGREGEEGRGRGTEKGKGRRDKGVVMNLKSFFDSFLWEKRVKRVTIIFL